MAGPGERQSIIGGFRSFVHDYGVLTLAVGVVIGNAVNDFVKSFVDGLITPLLSLIFPQKEIQDFQIVIHNSTFKIGQVVDGLITLLFIALVVYIAAVFVLRNEELIRKK